MTTVPAITLQWPRCTAAVCTALLHLLPLGMIGLLAATPPVWQQISMDMPTLNVSLITQAASAPVPAAAPAPKEDIPRPAEPAKKPLPVITKPVKKVAPTLLPTSVQTDSSAAPDSAPAPPARNTQDNKGQGHEQGTPASEVRDQSASALNRKAQPDYAYNPPPQYPGLLREQGISGVVLMRVKVRPDGQAQDVLVQQGSGYRLMDEAALRAVKRWRFIPALHNGAPEAGWVEFPIRFSLQD